MAQATIPLETILDPLVKEARERLEEMLDEVRLDAMADAFAAAGRYVAALVDGVTLPEPDLIAACLPEVRQWRDVRAQILEHVPQLADEGLDGFDLGGYFIAWDQFINEINQAWPGERLGWDQTPLELLRRLVDERDEAIELAASARPQIAAEGRS